MRGTSGSERDAVPPAARSPPLGVSTPLMQQQLEDAVADALAKSQTCSVDTLNGERNARAAQMAGKIVHGGPSCSSSYALKAKEKSMTRERKAKFPLTVRRGGPGRFRGKSRVLLLIGLLLALTVPERAARAMQGQPDWVEEISPAGSVTVTAVGVHGPRHTNTLRASVWSRGRSPTRKSAASGAMRFTAFRRPGPTGQSSGSSSMGSSRCVSPPRFSVRRSR